MNLTAFLIATLAPAAALACGGAETYTGTARFTAEGSVQLVASDRDGLTWASVAAPWEERVELAHSEVEVPFEPRPMVAAPLAGGRFVVGYGTTVVDFAATTSGASAAPPTDVSWLSNLALDPAGVLWAVGVGDWDTAADAPEVVVAPVVQNDAAPGFTLTDPRCLAPIELAFAADGTAVVLCDGLLVSFSPAGALTSEPQAVTGSLIRAVAVQRADGGVVFFAAYTTDEGAQLVELSPGAAPVLHAPLASTDVRRLVAIDTDTVLLQSTELALWRRGESAPAAIGVQTSGEVLDAQTPGPTALPSILIDENGDLALLTADAEGEGYSRTNLGRIGRAYPIEGCGCRGGDAGLGLGLAALGVLARTLRATSGTRRGRPSPRR